MKNFTKRSNETKNDSRMVAERFWNALVPMMQEKGYVLIPNRNPNKYFSEGLVIKGMEDQYKTYYGKPELSFRIADTWTWYAPLAKCSDPNEIQCLNTSMPSVHPRQNGPEKDSRPVRGWAVGFYRDNHYVTIAGSRWDPVTGEWEIVDPECSIEMIERLCEDRSFPVKK